MGRISSIRRRFQLKLERERVRHEAEIARLNQQLAQFVSLATDGEDDAGESDEIVITGRWQRDAGAAN